MNYGEEFILQKKFATKKKTAINVIFFAEILNEYFSITNNLDFGVSMQLQHI